MEQEKEYAHIQIEFVDFAHRFIIKPLWITEGFYRLRAILTPTETAQTRYSV